MRLAVALMALGIAAQPAQAQTDAAKIEKLIRGIYAGYGNPDAPPASEEPVLTRRLAAVRDECTALQEKVDSAEGADSTFGNCSEDYDVYCQCQDTFGTDWAKIGIRVRFPSPARAEADLMFDGEEGPDLKLVFARTARGWEIDDFWEYNRLGDGPGEASYRARVKKSVDAMRRHLKMPAWKEPAL